MIPTSPAGADTGAVIAGVGSTELDATLVSTDATHLGTYLATRTRPAPLRAGRAIATTVVATARDWLRREEAPAEAARAA
jgi:hypothetical protein